MSLFSSLHQFSTGRLSWILLFGFILFFLACAYTFQHVMDLAPCVMCIYERVAMIGIGIAALLGSIYPSSKPIRWSAILMWAGSSYKGMMLAIEHVSYQNNIFATCSPLIFPKWAPLNTWFPRFFEATGDCSEIVWQFLTLSMPQWLVVIFAASFAVACVIALSQLAKAK